MRDKLLVWGLLAATALGVLSAARWITTMGLPSEDREANQARATTDHRDPDPSSPIPEAATGQSRSDCDALAADHAAVRDPLVRRLASASVLRELASVPPVAWVEGYWVTPVDLSFLGAGHRRGDDDREGGSPASGGQVRPPRSGLAFASAAPGTTLDMPFVGHFTKVRRVTATRSGVFVVPVVDEDGVLLEYRPPRAPDSAGMPECVYFCGDPTAWDFDGDGEPNSVDSDDDADGVADEVDAFPYWPRTTECDCGGRDFVGFTGKFSSAVALEVLTAYEMLEQAATPVQLGQEGDGRVGVWLILPDEAGCPSAQPDCPPVETTRYVSRDPAACARLRFRCEAGEVPFSSECGCGCR